MKGVFILLRKEADKFIPSHDTVYDVIVAGGGPAGIGAALAAVANGAKTLILEATSVFGGVAPIALWMPVNRIKFNGVIPEGGKRGGVHDMFVEAIEKFGPEAYSEKRHPATDIRGGLSIHPEFLRLAIFELLEKYGCMYRLYSPVIGVLKDGNKVTGVLVSGKNGPTEFHAKIVVDCTGDGDVSYLAGVEMMKGREEDGLFLPPALLFALGNVDYDRFYDFEVNHKDKFYEIIRQADSLGYTTCTWYGFDEASLPGVVSVNNGGVKGWGNIDATDENDMTAAERMGIQAAIDFVRFARQLEIPGLENCTLIRAGARVAVRDSRRIVGEYIITAEDSREDMKFEDIVSRRYGFIDAVGYYSSEMKSGHAYPYRCLVPKEVDNLLVAGRCASATHLGFAAGRGMGEMMGMGQATGVAAALCSAKNILPRNIDVKEIQKILISMGVRL
jgi:hypothetical protein